MDAELMRALKPKITLQTAIRMHREYLIGLTIAAMTLPLDVAAAYWSTWAEVRSPRGAE